MNIDFNKEFKDKQEKLSKLKESFLDIYKIYEDLQKECVVLYNQYYFVFGEIFYKRYELYCLCERAKRKLELYYTSINRQESIDTEKVEKILDKEFVEYEEKLNNILREYNVALKFSELPRLSEEQSKELKRMYLKIAKKIHPDTVKEFTAEMKSLWIKTLEAYKHNNLEYLSECEFLLDNFQDIPAYSPSDYDILEKEIIKYQNKIKKYKNKNKIITSSFPYDKKETLENKELIDEKIEEVESDIVFFKDRLNKMELRIIELNPEYVNIIC